MIRDQFPSISDQDWQKLINRGVIPCSVSSQEDILSCLKKHKENGIEHTEAVKLTADDMRVSPTWVREVIRRWG